MNPRHSGHSRGWLLASLLLYLALVVAGGSSWEHMHDEAWTYRLSVGDVTLERPPTAVPVGEVISRLDGDPNRSWTDVIAETVGRGVFNPPAYYLLLHGSTGMLGTGRMAVRVPSYVLGLASILGLWLLARRLLPGSGVESWAAMLLATSPFFHMISNFARPYSLLACISIWSTYVALALMSGRAKASRRVAFVLLSLLGLYTVYHYAFVLLWHGAMLLAVALRSPRESRRRELAWLTVMVTLIAAGFVSWIPSFLVHASEAGTAYVSGVVPVALWPEKLLKMSHDFLLIGGLRSHWLADLRSALPFMELASLVLLLMIPFSKRKPAIDPVARGLLLSFPLVLVLTAVADVVNDSRTLFINKTCPLALVMLILLISYGGVAAPWRRVGRAVLGCWVLLSVAALASGLDDLRRDNSPIENFAQYLLETDEPSHLVILTNNGVGARIPLLLTLRDTGVRHIQLALARPSELGRFLTQSLDDSRFQHISVLQHQLPRPQPLKPGAVKSFEKALTHARDENWTLVSRYDDASQAASGTGRRVLQLGGLRGHFSPASVSSFRTTEHEN